MLNLLIAGMALFATPEIPHPPAGKPILPKSTASKPKPGARIPASGAWEANLWRSLAWKDEEGNFDPADFRRAVDQRRTLINSQKANSPGPDLPWVFRGPDNIGGRTRSLNFDPQDPNVILAGSVSGGIWRTTDGGITWNIVSNWLPTLAIGEIVRDPQNPNILYAGTGEGHFNGDAVGGVGILKSKDRGLTWNLLPNTTGFSNVCRMSIHPTNSNIVMASIRYGGLVRSTDGGNTWTTVRWAQGSYDVQFHPTNPNKLVAQVIDYDWNVGNWYHAALYSNDAGSTWQESSLRAWGFGPRVELAYAPSNPSIVYASVAEDDGIIYKSTDGGVSYTRVTTTGRSGTNWYANPLWVDPVNPNILVTGGYHLFRSDDGGVTLNQISDGYILTTDPHPDQHLVIQEPGYNGTTNRNVWICGDGGMYRSTDIRNATPNSTWQRREVSYNTTQYYGAAGHGPTGRIVGGTQDNGTHTLNLGSNAGWLTFGGDGGWSAIDPTDPEYIYGEYVYLTIHRSTNGGLWADWIYQGIDDAWSAANFIAPFVLDPSDPNTMYAGGRSLWRSQDVKDAVPTWNRIAGPNSTNISAIAVAPSDPEIVYFGLNNGEVWKTTNASAFLPTWTPVDNNGSVNPLPDRYIGRIAVNPGDANQFYVSHGGFAGDNLWFTTNGGLSFSDATGNLPLAPIRGVAIHPGNSSRIYVGTEVGLFVSTDAGTSWSTSDFGPAQVSVDEVNFMSDSQTLLVATHGRGLWTLDEFDPVGKFSGSVDLSEYNPGPNGEQVEISFFDSTSGDLRAIRRARLDDGGNFELVPGIPTGDYRVVVKGRTWLSREVGTLFLTSGDLTADPVMLLNGDVDGDNSVTIFDYIDLSVAFDTNSGDPGFNANADLDGDGSVTVFDYIILSGNFDLTGE